MDTTQNDLIATHTIDLMRVSAGLRNAAVERLVELESEIATTLETSEKLSVNRAARFEALQKQVNASVAGYYDQIAKEQNGALKKLVKIEGDVATKMVNASIGADVVSVGIAPKLLEAVVDQNIIFGHSSKDWWAGQGADLRQKFAGAVQSGILLGLPNDEIVKKVRGTKANEYADGIMSAKRREAEALVRSSVIAVSNEARLRAFAEMGDIVKGIQWVSTLDGRTTTICKALSGLVWRLPDFKPVGHDKAFPGPTAHWNCRSTQVAVPASWEEIAGKKLPSLGNDEIEAKMKEILASQGMSEAQIEKATAATQSSMDGQVPEAMTFSDWLATKSPAFIESTLGPGRAALWESGKVSIYDMTDQANRPLTLEQLEAVVATGSPAPETLGVNFLPVLSDPQKLSVKTTTELNTKAQAEIDAILGEPTGQTLKAKWLKKIAETNPELEPKDLLANATQKALEEQAAKSKAAVLSKAKKKLVAGGDLSPAEKATVDALSAEEASAFQESVQDAITLATEKQKAAQAALIKNLTDKAATTLDPQPKPNLLDPELKATWDTLTAADKDTVLNTLESAVTAAKTKLTAQVTEYLANGQDVPADLQTALAKLPANETVAIYAAGKKQFDATVTELTDAWATSMLTGGELPPDATAKSKDIGSAHMNKVLADAQAIFEGKVTLASVKATSNLAIGLPLGAGNPDFVIAKPATKQVVTEKAVEAHTAYLAGLVADGVAGKDITAKLNLLSPVDATGVTAKIVANKPAVVVPDPPEAAVLNHEFFIGSDPPPGVAKTVWKKLKFASNDPQDTQIVMAVKNDAGNLVAFAKVSHLAYVGYHADVAAFDDAAATYVAKALTTLGLKNGANQVVISVVAGDSKILQKDGKPTEYLFLTAKEFKPALAAFETVNVTVTPRQKIAGAAAADGGYGAFEKGNPDVSMVEDFPAFASTPEAGNAALAIYAKGGFAEINADPSAPVATALLDKLATLPEAAPPKMHRVLAFESVDAYSAFLDKLDAAGGYIQEKTLSSWTDVDPSAPGQTPVNNLALDVASQFGKHQVFLTVKNPVGAKDISFIYEGEQTEYVLPAGTKYTVKDVKITGNSKAGFKAHVEVELAPPATPVSTADKLIAKASPPEAKATGPALPEDAHVFSSTSTKTKPKKLPADLAEAWKGTKFPGTGAAEKIDALVTVEDASGEIVAFAKVAGAPGPKSTFAAIGAKTQAGADAIVAKLLALQEANGTKTVVIDADKSPFKPVVNGTPQIQIYVKGGDYTTAAGIVPPTTLLPSELGKTKPVAPGQTKAPKKAVVTTPALSPNPAAAVPAVAEMTFLQTLPGSTAPGLYESADGRKWVVKKAASVPTEHLVNEWLTDSVYRAAGVDAPVSRLSADNGALVKVAEFIDGAKSLAVLKGAEREAAFEAMRENFVLDALLGNWDVAGLSFDNVLVKNGKPIRIDNGGGMLYRAQGAPKDAEWIGPEVKEITSLRDKSVNAQTAAIFGSLTKKEITAQIEAVLAKRDDILAAVAGHTAHEDYLRKRLDWLETQVPKKKEPKARSAVKGAMEAIPANVATVVKKAGSTGWAYLGDRDLVEDNQILFWREKDQDGNEVTKVKMRLTRDGYNAMVKTATDTVGKLPGAVAAKASALAAPPAFETAYQTIITAVKNVNYNIGNGKTTFNQAKIDAAKAITLPAPKNAYEQDLKTKVEYAQSLLKASMANNVAVPKLPDTLPDQPPPPAAKKKAPKQASEWTATAGKWDAVLKNRTPDGALIPTNQLNDQPRATSKVVTFSKPGVSVALHMQTGAGVDGARSRGRNDWRDGHAAERNVEITLDGPPGPETVRQAMESLAAFGLDAGPATDTWKEMLLIHRTAYLRAVENQPAYAKIWSDTSLSDEAKLEALKTWAEKEWKVKLPRGGRKTWTKDYNPDGETMGPDGTGHRYWNRIDISEAEFQREMKDVRIQHFSSHPVEALIGWLENNGVITPTMERLRTGVSIKDGMSAKRDTQSGGAIYFYHSMVRKDAASATFVLKPDSMRRTDAWSINEDIFGDTDSKRRDRMTTPKEWKAKLKSSSSIGGDSAIVRNGLNFFDHIERINVDPASKKRMLDAFAKAGIVKLPDGRKVESLFQ